MLPSATTPIFRSKSNGEREKRIGKDEERDGREFRERKTETKRDSDSIST